MLKQHSLGLIALHSIGRLSSFTAAARELGISQSSVSIQIARLQAELNVRLAERTTRLTADGRELVDATYDAINELNVAFVQLGNRHSVGGLTVEVLTSFAANWLIPRLRRLHDVYHDITVTVRIQDDQTQPLSTHSDIGIRIAKSGIPGMHSEYLTSERIFPDSATKLRNASFSEAIQHERLLEDRMALADGSGCNWRALKSLAGWANLHSANHWYLIAPTSRSRRPCRAKALPLVAPSPPPLKWSAVMFRRT